MGFNPGATRRQDNDIFDLIAYGWAQASPGTIASGANFTVTVTVPGVTTAAGIGSSPWVCIGTWTSTNIGNFVIYAFVSGANQVTFIGHNNSGGGIAIPANTNFGVLMARINQRFTQPNVPGGTSG